MKNKTICIKSTFTSLLALAGMLVVSNVKAVSNDTWVGGTGNNFSTVANWSYSSGSGPVATGDSLIFDVVGSLAPNNDLTSFIFPSITYNSSAQAYTLGGNAFTLGTNSASTVIADNATSAQIINNAITLGNAVQTISLSGNLTLNGVLGGAGTASSLSINANSSTLLLNGANTYGSAGSTTINNGTVKIGNTSAFGQSRVNIYTSGSIDLNGNNLSVAFINNSGSLAGGVIDNVSAGGTVTLKVGSGQGGVNAASGTYQNIDSFSGIIQNTTGTVGLTKVAPSVANQSAGIMATASILNGPAVLRLINTNNYKGPTTVSGGILELNFEQANNGGPAVTANIISTNSTLVMAGGDLIVDESSVAGAQTFSNLILNAGASHLASYRNSSSAASLTLNGITRNVGSTVDFQSRPSGGSSASRIGGADGTDSTKTGNASFAGGQATILGGYATWSAAVPAGGGSWAVSAGNGTANGALSALGTFNTGFAAAKDVDAATGTSTPAAMTINSLRFNTAGSYTVNTSGNLVIATGGILETPLVGANAVAINNNSLTSSNGQDLIIHQFNTSAGMTIGANIVDNTVSIGLTKTGSGALTLTPGTANTFTGPLTLNAGTVTLGNANALNGNPALVFGGMSMTVGGASPNFIFANGTLNLNGNSASVASLSASADSCGTPTVQNASSTAATLTVNGTTTASFTGTLQDGTGGGSLSLVKSSSGTQTLGGTLSYSGGTTVSAGTLALTATPTATTNYAVNGTLNVTALTGGTLALVSPQVLSGSGTVSGSVSVASGAHTHPGATGVTNTITGNLTYVTGAKADFDLNTSATNSPSDQVVLSGVTSVLTCGSIQININLIGATLDTTNDYVLFKLTGGSASISGTFLSTPNWLGTVPANSGSYSIVTDTVHNTVRLHYIPLAAPTLVASATPAALVRNEATFVSVTVTAGSGTVTNVYLDMSSIGGSLSVPLTLSATANVYTNTVIIPAAAAVGSATIEAHATDTTPLTGTANIALTILATNQIWNGASSVDANWSDNTNWVSVMAPGLVGDSVTFDGTTQLAPSLDNNYSLTGLTFDSTAGAYVIGTTNSSALTLTGGLTNNSTSTQTLNVPVSLATAQSINAAAGNVAISGVVSGGSLTKTGANTLTLTGVNTYSGVTTVYPGILAISQTASVGTNMINLAGGTFSPTASLNLNGVNLTAVAGSNSFINMPAQMRLPNLYGAGTLNLNVNATGDSNSHYGDAFSACANFSGTLNITGLVTSAEMDCYYNGGTFDGQLQNAIVNLDNVNLVGVNGSTGNTGQFGALNVHANATLGGGVYAGSMTYQIGALNLLNDIEGNVVNGNVPSSIVKVGTGNLIMAGNDTYTGSTTVSGGTLTVLGSITASYVTNASGTTLAGTGTLGGLVVLQSGSQLAPAGVGSYGILNFTGGLVLNGATNLVDVSSSTNDSITVSSGLNVSGGATIKLNIASVPADGNYTLIAYDSYSGGSSANLTLTPTIYGGKTFTLVDTGSQIQLQVSSVGTASLTWTATPAAANNYWDVGTSVNWTNSAVPDEEYFLNGDTVKFDDSGAANSPVDIREPVMPNGVLVTNSSPYTFETTTSLGKLTGALTNGLTKSGSGTLTILTANTFTGPTIINAGTMVVGDGTTTGTAISDGNVTNNALLIFNQPDNSAVMGSLTGTGSLVKEGTGTLTINGNTTLSGTNLIAAGALQLGIGGATAIPTNTFTMAGGATLVIDRSGTLPVTNGIVGNGSLLFIGPGTNLFGGANSYLNNTYISNGVVKLTGAAAIPSGGSTTGWLILDGGATTAGTLDLNGFNQTVNALSGLTGTVKGQILNNGGTLTNTLTVNSIADTGFAGLILDNSGTGGKVALVKSGANTLTLSGNNTFSGGVTVSNGVLAINAATNLGTGMLTLSGGTLSNTASFNLHSVVNLTLPSGNSGTVIMPGLMKLADLYGSGTLTLDVNSTGVAAGSASYGDAFGFCVNFSGTLNITSAVTSAKMNLNFNNNSGYSFDGELQNATVNVQDGVSLVGSCGSTGNTAQLGALNVDSASSLGGSYVGGTITYQIGALGTTSDIEGTIINATAASAITKVGTGNLIINSTGNTYTGNTTVNGGTLTIGASGNIAASVVTVNAAGTLAGTGTLGTNVIVNGTLAPGVTGSGALTVSGNLTLNAGSTNTFAVNGSTPANTSVVLGGAATYGGVLNIVPAGTFTAGQTFTLISGTGATQPGNFASIAGSPGAGLGFAFTNGVLSVVTAGPVGFTIPPGITNFNIVNYTNVVMSGTNGQSGDAYYLLTSTNVAQPKSQWKTVATNVLGASGGFSITATNVVTAGAGQQFYILSSTNYNP